MKLLMTVCLLALLALPVRAEEKKEAGNQPKGELIFLRDFGTDEVAYLAIPDKKPEAGIVVAHGKFGLCKDTRLLCDRLAESGLIVLAVDLFNGSVPANEAEIAKFTGSASSETTVAAIETGINFFLLSPRFKMDKVIVLGIGESTRDVLAVARKNRDISGVTLLEPKVLPNAELMNQIGVPVLAYVSSEREITIDVGAINAEAKAELTMELMPEVIHDDMKAFKRHINDRIWKDAIQYWMKLEVHERSIADKLIDTVF
ncbi:MAG: dienelactone hydrolase family protein [Verrucomicrobiota bacterium]